jgi:hypothetical protein
MTTMPAEKKTLFAQMRYNYAMTTEKRAFHAFWTSLVPRSNRRTGFSIRGATKRPFIAFDLVGFRFSYRIDYDAPDAEVAFHIVRSDDDDIYDELLQRRAEIETAFGAPLRWLPAAPVPGNSWPSPAIVAEIACPALRHLSEEQWPGVQDRMIDAMVRLERAIAPQVQQWLPE